MIRRSLALFCVTGTLLVLGGCDLEGVVKQKVPEPLKNILTFGSSAQRKAKDGPVQFTPAHVQIVSPLSNGVYPANKPVEFRALVRLPVEPGKPRPSLTWTVFKETDKDKHGKNLGAAESVTSKLEPGKYRVELTESYRSEERRVGERV